MTAVTVETRSERHPISFDALPEPKNMGIMTGEKTKTSLILGEEALKASDGRLAKAFNVLKRIGEDDIETFDGILGTLAVGVVHKRIWDIVREGKDTTQELRATVKILEEVKKDEDIWRQATGEKREFTWKELNKLMDDVTELTNATEGKPEMEQMRILSKYMMDFRGYTTSIIVSSIGKDITGACAIEFNPTTGNTLIPWAAIKEGSGMTMRDVGDTMINHVENMNQMYGVKRKGWIVNEYHHDPNVYDPLNPPKKPPLDVRMRQTWWKLTPLPVFYMQPGGDGMKPAPMTLFILDSESRGTITADEIKALFDDIWRTNYGVNEKRLEELRRQRDKTIKDDKYNLKPINSYGTGVESHNKVTQF
jgi:hypothetical protein